MLPRTLILHHQMVAQLLPDVDYRTYNREYLNSTIKKPSWKIAPVCAVELAFQDGRFDQATHVIGSLDAISGSPSSGSERSQAEEGIAGHFGRLPEEAARL
jgi:hypothetical protein